MKVKNPDHIIYVCLDSKCAKHGSKEFYKKMKSLIKKSGKDVELIKTECTDRCKLAPVLSIQPENEWLLNFETEAAIKKIVASVLKK